MSKKNKNKHKQPYQGKPIQTNKPTLTDEQKMEIEMKKDELEKDNVQPVEQLSSESEVKFKEAEEINDLVKYWNYVKEINKKYEALINSVSIEKEKATKLKEEYETSKREVEAIKIEYKKKLDEYNRKDKELTEREFALDNGEYTGVIRRLLDTIKETEKKVFIDTENQLKELSEFHKRNLEELSKSLVSNSELQKHINDFKKEKIRFEIEKVDFEENLREEFLIQLTEKTKELEHLQRKLFAIQEENTKLKKTIENLQSAFNSTDPEEILNKNSLMKKEIETLKKELNERPYRYELEIKQDKIEELQSKVNELKEKINEEELTRLKTILINSDTYIYEINQFKSQIESLKLREATLKKTNKDLTITIDQLKGEALNKADAFEFAKKCDADKENFGKDLLRKNIKNPRDLRLMVSYIQQWMAFKSDKPFYYDLDTIRIFLAGLHMSPITILQGISGTGKTSLPREFAKALISDPDYVGLDVDNQNKAPYRICAVQSGWRDNMDLMGYYNSFEHKYKETDFFKALYVANQPKYSNTLFFIILDEMNLSRPEHYFADFLSLLEQSPNERYISLTNTPNEVLPKLIVGGKLKIPENVRFVGTANHDETTLEFAPKTYDRSNVIEMPKNYEKVKKNATEFEPLNISYIWLNEQFVNAVKKHSDSFLKFLEFIDSDDLKLLLIEKGIGIGNRFEHQAERFIGVFVESGDNKVKDLATATDHLITSRLFRTLKNRYDLDKTNLTNFKNDYVKLFEKTFNNQKPSFTIDLLDTEISKK